jgi:hypothetical protein
LHVMVFIVSLPFTAFCRRVERVEEAQRRVRIVDGTNMAETVTGPSTVEAPTGRSLLRSCSVGRPHRPDGPLTQVAPFRSAGAPGGLVPGTRPVRRGR